MRLLDELSHLNHRWIPNEVSHLEHRYLCISNLVFFIIFVYLFIQLMMILAGVYPDDGRLYVSLLIFFCYPMFYALKWYGVARFSLLFLILMGAFYFPLITGRFSQEFFYRTSYQPLILIFGLLWCLHPQADRFWFYLTVALTFPIVALGPLIAEKIKPGTIPADMAEKWTQFTVIPAMVFIGVLISGILLVKQREKSLDSLSMSNQRLLEAIVANQEIARDLRKQVESSTEKINLFLALNSHELRLPISNMKGLYAMLKNENHLNGGQINQELLDHLEATIEHLDQKIHQINESLEQNPS